jgi:hypothetical protein
VEILIARVPKLYAIIGVNVLLSMIFYMQPMFNTLQRVSPDIIARIRRDQSKIL